MLGPWNLVTLGIGGIVGAGIFVITGQAAALYAGPAISISFLISGIACGFAGLCYAELASLIPVSGSAYTYAYAAFGELIAWIIGWDLVLEYLFAASTVAGGWSGVCSMLPLRHGNSDTINTGRSTAETYGSRGLAINGCNLEPSSRAHPFGAHGPPGARHQGIGTFQ